VNDLVDAVKLAVVNDEHPAPHLCRRDHHGPNSKTWAAASADTVGGLAGRCSAAVAAAKDGEI
jgi:hypothetical protein